MLLVGFFETFAAGWIYGLEDQINKFGRPVILSYFFANFGSVFIASVLWFGIPEPSVSFDCGDSCTSATNILTPRCFRL